MKWSYWENIFLSVVSLILRRHIRLPCLHLHRSSSCHTTLFTKSCHLEFRILISCLEDCQDADIAHSNPYHLHHIIPASCHISYQCFQCHLRWDQLLVWNWMWRMAKWKITRHFLTWQKDWEKPNRGDLQKQTLNNFHHIDLTLTTTSRSKHYALCACVILSQDNYLESYPATMSFMPSVSTNG